MDGPATAFVVLAHKNPTQLARLCERLRPAPVYLHLDANAGDVLGDQTLPDNVTFLPRIPISWAGWSQVEATLTGLRHAYADGARHVITLSGQDYPLRPMGEIDAFFAATPDASYAWLNPLPYRPYWGPRFGGLDRANLVNLTWRGTRRLPLPIPQRPPLGMRPHGGSAFLALSRNAIEQILTTLEDPRAVRYFKRTWLPVEIAFPTIVGNSALPNVRENLWYVRWPPSRGAHPAVLTAGDLDGLLAEARGPGRAGGPARFKLFARKFDTATDSEILDLIDAELLAQA